MSKAAWFYSLKGPAPLGKDAWKGRSVYRCETLLRRDSKHNIVLRMVVRSIFTFSTECFEQYHEIRVFSKRGNQKIK